MTFGQFPQPAPVNPARLTGLPVEPRSFSAFYRAPRWRWWKPPLALLAAGVTWLVLNTIAALVGMIADGTDLVAAARTGTLRLGPWGFLGNNVGVALAIGVAMLTQWLFFGQRPRWLSSVAGRLRWWWLAVSAAVVLPVWAMLLGAEYLLGGLPSDIRTRPYTVLLIAGIVLTTPVQAAGEEYLIRGLELRLVASYFRNERLGWAAGATVSAVTFTLLHAAADPWLNVYYFSFGLVAAWLAWRTGGLEASIVIHVVNNVLGEALMPFTDFSDMFDRSVGTGNPIILVQVLVLVVVAVVLDRLASRLRLTTASAPGLAILRRV